MAQLGLENLRSRHAGRMAIIAGAGPSLRHLEPDAADKHVMLAVNSSIIKFTKAQYFFTCDPGVTIQHSWQIAKQSECTIVIAQPEGTPEGFGAYDSQNGSNYLDGMNPNRVTYVYRKPESHTLAFNPSDKTIIFGWSSAHCAAHLAYLMGCKPILLVGCDCGLEEGKRYHYDFPGHEQHRDYVQKPEMEKYFAREMDILYSFVNYWDRIGSDNPNVEILNCGNAILPEIEPMRLADALKRYG